MRAWQSAIRLGVLGVCVAGLGACSTFWDAAQRQAGQDLAHRLIGGDSANTQPQPQPTTTTPSTPAPQPTGATASGSCMMLNADHTPMMCSDFSNVPAEAIEIMQHNSCVAGTSTWSSTTCSPAGRQGGCRSKPDEHGMSVTQWYYMPNLANAAHQSCVQSNGAVWVP
jgi:hypothetical protein